MGVSAHREFRMSVLFVGLLVVLSVYIGYAFGHWSGYDEGLKAGVKFMRGDNE